MPVRHSRINENQIVMEEIQNRDCQYLVKLVIKLVEHDKNDLKPLPKAGRKIMKSMKHNYRVAWSVYASTYANMAEQFKIYLNSPPPDEIDETENDFRANGNRLLSVRQTESVTELFNSFAIFYYINGRLLYMDGLLFVPDVETPVGIIEEKLNLKELFAKIFRTGSNGLVLSPFLATLLLFFARKEALAVDFLTKLYKNFTADVLSSDKSENTQFAAFTDVWVELGVWLGNLIFANHEKARLDVKKTGRRNKQKTWFF